MTDWLCPASLWFCYNLGNFLAYMLLLIVLININHSSSLYSFEVCSATLNMLIGGLQFHEMQKMQRGEMQIIINTHLILEGLIGISQVK